MDDELYHPAEEVQPVLTTSVPLVGLVCHMLLEKKGPLLGAGLFAIIQAI